MRAYRKALRDEASRIWHARKEGRAEGEAKGRTEGEAKGRAEVARSMLQRQMPADVIAELTGLSPDEIKKLKEALI
jgi:predicted transposase/invertase (TIGR01784 family)